MENTGKTVAAYAADDNARAVGLGEAIRQVGTDVFEKAYNVALEREPNLARCTTESVVGALLRMLQLGLGFDHVSLDWRGKECGFQITHKGYIELANLRAKAAA